MSDTSLMEAVLAAHYAGKDITEPLVVLLANVEETVRAERDREHQTELEADREARKGALYASLAAMLRADKALYERCLDTLGFANHFNAICNMAKAPRFPLPTPTPEKTP